MLNQQSTLKKPKVWMDDLCAIFDKPEIIPIGTMTKNEKINAITRLVLVIFVIMSIVKYPYSVTFLALALIIILILYFINTKEYYSSMDHPTQYRNPLIAQNSQAIKKMALQPIITPRAHDREVWSHPSYRHSAVNYNHARYDLSEQYEPVEQKEEYKDFDLRLSSYTNFTLDKYGEVCNAPLQPKTNHPSVNTSTDTISGKRNSISDMSRNYYAPPPSSNGSTPIEEVTPIEEEPSIERFALRRPPNPALNKFSSVNNKYQQRRPPNPALREGFAPRRPPNPALREGFGNVVPSNKIIRENENSNYAVIPEESEDNDFVPNQDLLIPKTITSIYGPGAVSNEEKIKYLTQIQPDSYSYSDVTYPINSNLGITYTPENPPRVLDQVATPYGTYPLYHRIDPQLIRDGNIPPERQEELPRRTAWSAKYSMFDAAPGTVNFEDIYDPRFNGYGDEYRSYGDVNLGQVQYYYSDLDAYRYPNFGIRSKVDYIDYIDPMGRVLPEYDRQVGLNDIKQTVHDQYTADALYFREGLQERLMKKRNRELWQLRAAPIRKDAHASTFTSHM